MTSRTDRICIAMVAASYLYCITTIWKYPVEALLVTVSIALCFLAMLTMWLKSTQQKTAMVREENF